MPSRIPLSISVTCLPTEHPLQLPSVTDYWYIVALNSGGASPTWRGGVGYCPPVGAEQREDAAPRHIEVHAAQHTQLLVRLLQALHVDRRPLDLVVGGMLMTASVEG